jgi:acetyl esterase/lipase
MRAFILLSFFPLLTAAAEVLPPLKFVQLPPPDREISIYEGVAPGSEKWNWEERTFVREDGHTVTQNVVHPVLQYFAPDPAKACGTALIVAPGGGHTNLVIMSEGREVVARLQAMGIGAFLLKYRLIHVAVRPDTSRYIPEKREHGVILTGAQQGQSYADFQRDDGFAAMRWLRAHAGEFGCDPHRIGFMGFSAGGIPALGTVFGPGETRPDFAMAIEGPYLEDQPAPANAPPLFLAAAAADEWGASGSIKLFQSWRAAKLPVELHLFEAGDHGIMSNRESGNRVMEQLAEWLRISGWLTKPQAAAVSSKSAP